MKKLTGLGAVIADIAHRKARAAKARFQKTPPGTEAPREIYERGCATVAAAFVAEGFRFAPSGPHATRASGDLTHHITFQSSRNNVAGEHVALWVHAHVSSKRLRGWYRQHGGGFAYLA